MRKKINRRTGSLKVRFASEIALALSLLLLLGTGCGTVQEHRARQHRSAFEAFPPPTQAHILDAGIVEGWPPVAIYISLGTPDNAERLDAHTVEWTYWGYRYGPDNADPTNHPPFHTRSEISRPPRGQPLEKMIIRFTDNAVTEWSFHPLERSDMGRQRQTPFGQMPNL